jgi:ABC-2 type transport system ATP-binding protein
MLCSPGAQRGSWSVAVLPELALLFDHVTKRFGPRAAVDDLSFQVPRGTVYGLLGPNGAGKTTSIRMLMAIVLPDSGRVRVLGKEPTDALKDRIGYLPEERGLYRTMKVIDNLTFFGGIRGLAPADARRKAVHWLERLGMTADADRRLQELSKGNQQKIQLIATVMHAPDLLVLDEPFSGLDPVNLQSLREIILELARGGTTIVLSTHLMDEVERLCSHLTLISSGRALVSGALDEVKRRHGADVVRVDVAGDPEPLESHPDVAESRRIGRTLELRLRDGRDPSRFLAAAAALVPLRRFEVQAPSLHSIFVSLVGQGPRPAGVRAPEAGAPAGAEVET